MTYAGNKSVYLFRCSYKGLIIRADIFHESAYAMRSASADVQSVVGSPLSMSRSVRDALSRNVNERQNVCRLARGPVGPWARLIVCTDGITTNLAAACALDRLWDYRWQSCGVPDKAEMKAGTYSARFASCDLSVKSSLYKSRKEFAA